MPDGSIISDVAVGNFTFIGDFTAFDLIAATTNALNGALLARRPDHYRNFTVVGVLLMALLGGLGGVPQPGRCRPQDAMIRSPG